MISDTLWTKNAGNVVFSEPHGDTAADINGDGIPDFIVGKRYWTHLDSYADPDTYGSPVIYWYETVRIQGSGRRAVCAASDQQSLGLGLRHSGG